MLFLATLLMACPCLYLYSYRVWWVQLKREERKKEKKRLGDCVCRARKRKGKSCMALPLSLGLHNRCNKDRHSEAPRKPRRTGRWRRQGQRAASAQQRQIADLIAALLVSSSCMVLVRGYTFKQPGVEKKRETPLMSLVRRRPYRKERGKLSVGGG